MKVAILTLPLHSNYGGILQAYAMQVALESLGHEAQLIRHNGLRPTSFGQVINRWIPGFLPVRLKNGEFCLLSTRRKARRTIEKNMTSFVDDNIRLTTKLYLKENLVLLNGGLYDAIVVGSDQIWRPSYVGNIRAYFLDFIHNRSIKKIAYAPSFGASEWELSAEETVDCSLLLKSFSAVSVREKNAVEWCRTKFDREAILVVDPTMLLDAAHYAKFVSKPVSEAYLCSYILDTTENIKLSIDALCRKKNLLRISPIPECQYSDVGQRGFDRCIYPSINYWLSSFYYSDLVITDSFHGTVFAIMFNKPFVTVVNKGRGASRFESFLGELGLLSRLVESVEDAEQVLQNLPEIDWPAVSNRLELWRSRSFEFLRSTL